jgi:hypothetical protein
MTEEEAAPFVPELQPFPKDHKYHFEYVPAQYDTDYQFRSANHQHRPDMFHNLHCINAIRMKMTKTMYGDSIESHSKHHQNFPESIVGPNYENTHLEHCLDRLRQAVMCHGDLTPSPLYIFDGFPVAIGKTGKRTCRKFEPIREWMNQRGKGALDEL